MINLIIRDILKNIDRWTKVKFQVQALSISIQLRFIAPCTVMIALSYINHTRNQFTKTQITQKTALLGFCAAAPYMTQKMILRTNKDFIEDDYDSQRQFKDEGVHPQF